MTVLPKDTGSNILHNKEFVANLVSEDLAEAMSVTCIDAPAGIDEMIVAGLNAISSVKVAPPRIERSPVALECVLHGTVPLSPNQLSRWELSLLCGSAFQAGSSTY